MKAFEPCNSFEKEDENHFTYPEEMEVILDYLEENGKLNAKPKTIEKLYRKYSNEVWAAGWMSVMDYYLLDEEVLSGFAHWLSKIDI